MPEKPRWVAFWTKFDPEGLDASSVVDAVVDNVTQAVQAGVQEVKDSLNKISDTLNHLDSPQVRKDFAAGQATGVFPALIDQAKGAMNLFGNPITNSLNNYALDSLSSLNNYVNGKVLPQLGVNSKSSAFSAGQDLATAETQIATAVAVPENGTNKLSAVSKLEEAAEGGSSVTFYSVQSEADAARLASGGAPWPTGLQRANLGEGLYAWGSRADAEAYAANKSGVQILEHTMSSSDYASLNSLDLRTMSDENATSWLNKYSQYGEGQPHGLDHVIRTTGAGDEYYFSPSAFQLFK